MTSQPRSAESSNVKGTAAVLSDVEGTAWFLSLAVLRVPMLRGRREWREEGKERGSYLS